MVDIDEDGFVLQLGDERCVGIDGRATDPHACGHLFERRPRELVGVAQRFVLRGREPVDGVVAVVDRRTVERHTGDAVFVGADRGRTAELGDLVRQRHDFLAHLETARRVHADDTGRRRVVPQRHRGVDRAREEPRPTPCVGERVPRSNGHGSSDGSSIGMSMPHEMSKRNEMEQKRILNEPLPLARHGRGPDSVKSSEIEHSVLLPRRRLDPGRDVDLERERRQHEQRVETEVAEHVEARRLGRELERGTHLDRVRRDREVRVEGQARVVAVAELDLQPAQGGEARGRREPRVEPAERQREHAVAEPPGTKGHVAREGEGRDARVVQRRVDRELALGDVEHAEHVDVQLDDRELFVGEQGRELTEQDEPHGHRQLEEDADLGGDDAQGGTPRDERHRPEHEPIARGKDRLEVGDDPVGVADRIGREEHGIGRARLDAAARARRRRWCGSPR